MRFDSALVLRTFMEPKSSRAVANLAWLWRRPVHGLQALLVTDLEGDTVERSITIPRLDDYLAVHIGGLPYAAAFQALADDARRAYGAQVEQDLSRYRTSEAGFKVPFALHFVSATAATDRNR